MVDLEAQVTANEVFDIIGQHKGLDSFQLKIANATWQMAVINTDQYQDENGDMHQNCTVLQLNGKYSELTQYNHDFCWAFYREIRRRLGHNAVFSGITQNEGAKTYGFSAMFVIKRGGAF